MKEKIATTVKIPESLYDEFKVLGIRHKVSLQTLVEKCVNLFVTDEKFREIVQNYTIPKLSQSGPTTTITALTGSSIQ